MFESRKKLCKQIEQLEKDNKRLRTDFSYQLSLTIKLLKEKAELEQKVKELENALISDQNHQIHIHYNAKGSWADGNVVAD